MLQKILIIAVAGGLGALARYGLSGVVQRWTESSGFPWGTAAVNVLGCFLFGLVWALADERMMLSSEVRTFLLIGFLGAFTTFSTFTSETSRLIADSEWLAACGNLLLQNVLGIAVFFGGLALGRWI